MLAPGHTQTQWMRLLIATLRDAGIERFVVSPGSRSTPLVAAIQHEKLEILSCVDERSASFFALGMTRATGNPVALVCTSGTAGAHYYPAVIEATRSELPLVVLTADRPGELQDNCSPQTINQTNLFNDYVRWFVDLGSPDHRMAALRGLRRKLGQAVSLAKGPAPGAVHLNVPAYKPLEPEEPHTAEECQHATLVAELRATPLTAAPCGHLALDETALLEVSHSLRQAVRPVLFCGPSLSHRDAVAVAAFATRVRWPVLAELTSPVRQTLRGSELLCEAFELLARVQPTSLFPDLVVHVGATATSSAWYKWMSTGGCVLAAISANQYADPLNRLSLLIRSDVAAALEGLAPRLPCAANSWPALWRRANQLAREVARSTSAARPDLGPLRETQVVASLGRLLRNGDALILGNSLPIRVAETCFDSDAGYRCYSQRGTNGIDGLIAGAVGTALLTQGRSLLVLGDVSALHDLGSLQLLAHFRPSLVVCLIDNNGGRIFDELPISAVAADLSPWTTPHRFDLSAVTRALGLPTWTVQNSEELERALDVLPAKGPSVLVCQVDPRGSSAAYAEWTARLRHELVP